MQPQIVFVQTFIRDLVTNGVRACNFFFKLTYGASARHHLHDWLIELEPGTVYLPRLKPPTHCCSSGERQKRTSSTSRFWTNLRTIADSRTPQCSQYACLNYVQCPCNVSMWQCHSNLFLNNNNNNNNNWLIDWLIDSIPRGLKHKFLTGGCTSRRPIPQHQSTGGLIGRLHGSIIATTIVRRYVYSIQALSGR